VGELLIWNKPAETVVVDMRPTVDALFDEGPV
jgi:hypothetical protein